MLPLAALFFAAGVAHFVAPMWFDQIMPAWVPNPRLATYLSGGAEIAGALGLLLPATRAIAGWGLIVLLLAVFPANVQMLQLARASHGEALYIALLWARLPLQLALLWWVHAAAIRPRA